MPRKAKIKPQDQFEASMVPVGSRLDKFSPDPLGLPTDVLFDQLDLFRAWYPVVSSLGDPEGLTGGEILDRIQPLSVLMLLNKMMTSKKDSDQITAAKEIAYMSGLKPIERSFNVNVNNLGRREAGSLLASKLEKYGITVIDSGLESNVGQGSEGPLETSNPGRELKEQT